MSFLKKLLNNFKNALDLDSEVQKRRIAKKALEVKKKLEAEKKLEAKKKLEALRIEARWELMDKELNDKKDIYKPKKKILFIDKDSRDSLGELLEYQGYEVQKSQSGIEGQRLAEQYSPDLILLTSKSTDIDGFTLCYRLKKDEKTSNIPTLMMLNYFEQYEIFMIPGFKFLVSDHLKSFFLHDELSARMRHLLHINNRNSIYDKEILNYGPLTLVPETFEAIWFESRIRLNLFEFELLFSLLQRHGQTVSYSLLINEVMGYWDAGCYDKDAAKIVRPHIRSLRMKLEPNPIKPIYIKTFYKKGYCLNIH